MLSGKAHDPTQVNRQGPDFGAQYHRDFYAFAGAGSGGEEIALRPWRPAEN